MAKFLAQVEQDAIIADAFAAGKYVALITTAPTAIDGSGLVEVSTSATGYARQPVGSANATTTSGSGLTAVRQATNAGVYNFGPATADWPQIVGVAIYDAATNGSFKYYGDLTTPKTVLTGDSFQIAAGSLTVQA
jgi:hypothetical protein